MYSVKPTSYGFKIVFEGMIKLQEMSNWYMDSIKILKVNTRKPFEMMVDMSQMGPLFQDTKTELEKGQELFRRMGMRRSAVIVPSRMVAKQLKDVAAGSKIAATERYISVEEKDAEAKAMAWLISAKEPV